MQINCNNLKSTKIPITNLTIAKTGYLKIGDASLNETSLQNIINNCNGCLPNIEPNICNFTNFNTYSMTIFYTIPALTESTTFNIINITHNFPNSFAIYFENRDFNIYVTNKNITSNVNSINILPISASYLVASPIISENNSTSPYTAWSNNKVWSYTTPSASTISTSNVNSNLYSDFYQVSTNAPPSKVALNITNGTALQIPGQYANGYSPVSNLSGSGDTNLINGLALVKIFLTFNSAIC